MLSIPYTDIYVFSSHRYVQAPLSPLLPQWVTLSPLQMHCFWWACFISIVAPFGGFFASGFKRAFKVKDFGDLIPGHGGIVDRMDCQIVTGLFVYVYYLNFIQVRFII